ncbi:NAD-dependent deacylase [Pseudomonas silvicola]|nr:NAD-dependent deacylase [Pseudomonas silvicola]
MSELRRAADALRHAGKIVVFTGAGISAESGIPTFRDELTGLWSMYDPQRLETANAFRENPALVWSFYLWRRRQAKEAKPNLAHLLVQSLESSRRQVSVITQNIDDLHERAGSTDIIHLHGSLNVPKCFACHRPAELAPEQFAVPAHGLEKEPPRCERCNGRLRPGVVWFKEDLPVGAWKGALTNARECDVLLSIGTSGVVTPAADIPVIAHSAGATVIHVNLEDVSLEGENEVMLVGKATEVLASLFEAAGI